MTVALILAVVAPECATASPPLKVSVERKGTYIVWFTYTDALGSQRVTEPQRFKGDSADVDVTALGTGFKNARLFVMEKRSSNMAIVEYAAAKDPKAAKPIGLSSEDFTRVRRINLRVVAAGSEPLASGVITITDGEGTEMSEVITPADLGEAVFENVAAGEINVRVKAEGLTKTIDSDFELPLDRSDSTFKRDIKVAGDVDTVIVPEESVQSPGVSERSAERRMDALGAVLQFVTGLLFLVVVVAVIAIILRGKGLTAKGALKSIGVSLPEDGETPAAAAPDVDPNVCRFCGKSKDAMGKCACTVAPGSPPPTVGGPSVGAGPRLIGTEGPFAGHVFEISEGSATIGREEGNSVVLANDNTASRRHATIVLSGSDVTIRDEGSSNGTFVNGARITEQSLSPGDEIHIGASRFRFER